jgi:hypothetical protein
MLLNSKKVWLFLSFCMMNVSAADLDDDNFHHKSCDNKVDDSVSATCVEYNTKTLENSYPTDVSSYPTGVSSSNKNSINKLGVLSLIGYLLF